jgi:hypothetical protein
MIVLFLMQLGQMQSNGSKANQSKDGSNANQCLVKCDPTVCIVESGAGWSPILINCDKAPDFVFSKIVS